MAWSDATLAEPKDVRKRYGRAGELTGEEGEAAQNNKLNEYISRSKEYIGRRLDVELKPLLREKSYSAADLKDLISNPDVFKPACVAYALKLLCEDAILVSEEELNYSRMKDFEKEFEREFSMSLRLTQYDSDESGDISDEEKAEGLSDTTFFRI